MADHKGRDSIVKTEHRIVEVDLDGKALVNSLGQKFDPPIKVPFVVIKINPWDCLKFPGTS